MNCGPAPMRRIVFASGARLNRQAEQVSIKIDGPLRVRDGEAEVAERPDANLLRSRLTRSRACHGKRRNRQ